MKGIACGQSNDNVYRRVFIPDRLCDVNFCHVPMVEGGDGISSALDRFGPFFRVSTSIGLYSVDLRSREFVVLPIGRYRGRCLSWLVDRKAAGANLTSQTLTPLTKIGLGRIEVPVMESKRDLVHACCIFTCVRSRF